MPRIPETPFLGRSKMKTSLVIPATNGNFEYLKCILAHYRDGTVKPDQVIVSLSNAHLVKNTGDLEDKFKDTFEDFQILKHNQTMIQGPNRDAASMAADNEIIISNDADDIPHPQRIEVIKHFFENKNILHLNHSYQMREDTIFEPVNIEDIVFLNTADTFRHHFPNYMDDLYEGIRPDPRSCGYRWHCYGAQPPWNPTEPAATHAGCPAFHRDVFKQMRWRQVEDHDWDWDFVLDVLFHLRKSIIINSKLLWYNLNQNRRNTNNALGLGPLYKE